VLVLQSSDTKGDGKEKDEYWSSITSKTSPAAKGNG